MDVEFGFKKTELGQIPEDWDLTDLGRACRRLTTGKLDANAMNPDGEYRFYTCAKEFYYIDNYAFDTEALLVSGNGANVGYIHYYKGKFNAYQRTYVLSDFVLSVNFLKHYLGKNLAERIRVELNAGNTPYITRGTLTEMPVVAPSSLAEQEAIAEALSDADALIESLEQLLAKKRHIKQGAMQELLTGKKRLPGFSGAWDVKRLGSVLTIMHGKSQYAVEDKNGIYPILATGGQIGTANQFIYDRPSVLIGRKGTIDRPQYVDRPFWTVDTLFYSIVLEENNAKFLFFRFCLIDWKRHNEASGVPSLNARTIEQIEIKMPPPDEQTALATILSDMDAEITALEAKLTKARAIKQGMMQELLTGRIRLI